MAEPNKYLKIAMLQAELNNKQISEQVGIHATNMSAITNGAIPHLRTAQKIVRALNGTGKVNVTIDELWPLRGEDE